MKEFFEVSVYFGVFISLVSYGAGTWLKKRFGLAVFNNSVFAAAPY